MVSKDNRIQATLTPQYAKALNDLVKSGAYLNDAEAFRDALSLLFRYHKIEFVGKETGG